MGNRGIAVTQAGHFRGFLHAALQHYVGFFGQADAVGLCHQQIRQRQEVAFFPHDMRRLQRREIAQATGNFGPVQFLIGQHSRNHLLHRRQFLAQIGVFAFKRQKLLSFSGILAGESVLGLKMYAPDCWLFPFPVMPLL